MEKEPDSKAVARAAVQLALTATREGETALKQSLLALGIQGSAVDYGGEFVQSIMRMVERTISAARRDGLIDDSFLEEGAVAGAAHEAISQVSAKALGLNVGGKIAVARGGANIAVAVFFGVGLVHLDEVCIGLSHRAI